MTRPPAITLAAVTAAATVLAGCGITNPDAASAPAPRTLVGHHDTRRTLRVPGDGGGDRALLARFATAWTTYTFATLPRQQRDLGELATGDLARQLDANAEQDLQAQYVRVSDERSHGTVEAIVLRRTQPAIVVVRATSTADGHTQTGWTVYLATLASTRAGRRIATWTPATSN
jgi:hypothetical protein